MSNASEVWVSHASVQSWQDAARWSAYLEEAQDLLGAKLTHLDTNDPIRRTVRGQPPREWGEYWVDFGLEEETRWLFGKLESTRILFQLRHHRGHGNSANSFNWYFSKVWARDERAPRLIADLFELGNRHLAPFYSYSDVLEPIRAKNKPTGAVNLEREPVGVFWLTYFDARYADKMPLQDLDDARVRSRWTERSVTLQLADAPWNCESSVRAEVESLLGSDCFVDPASTTKKPICEHVLALEQLRDR